MPLHGLNRQRPTNRERVDMNKVSGIYRIDLGNGYFYIGSAVDLGRREGDHRRALKRVGHRNIKMQNIWNKHGVFRFAVLEECTKDKLLMREDIYLKTHFDDPKNVNLVSAAGSTLGFKHSDETKEKMSAAHKGVPKSVAQRENMSASARNMSAEHRANLSLAASNASAEHRAKNSAGQMGRVVSAETRAKNSAWQLKRPRRVISAEACANMSAAQKLSWVRRRAG